jgi:hypothetical protein
LHKDYYAILAPHSFASCRASQMFFSKEKKS